MSDIVTLTPTGGDDTTLIQNAMNSGAASIYLAGGFKCSKIFIPSSLHVLGGRAITAIDSFSGAWFDAVAPVDGIRIEGLQFVASSGPWQLGYSSNPVLSLKNFRFGKVQNCIFFGGRFSVEIIGSLHGVIEGCEMNTFNQTSVHATGSNDTLSILNNGVAHTGPVGHAMQIGDLEDPPSSDCVIAGNAIYGGPGFGIHVHHQKRGHIHHNTVRETVIEAITVGGASEDTGVNNNIVRWNSAGNDVGMSCDGDDANHVCRRIDWHDNIIIRAFKGGMIVDQFSDGVVFRNNQIIGCNRGGGTSAPSGINILSASAFHTVATGNLVDNTEGGHMPYAVSEDPTAGYTPHASYIANNMGRGMTAGQVLLKGSRSIQANNIALPTEAAVG